MKKIKIYIKNQGFTIVELLVVIVIIGILASITVISYSGVTNKATVVSIQSDLANSTKQLKIFQVINGAYPTANNCPTPAINEICLKPSLGTVFQYIPGSSIDPSIFNLTATNNNLTYSANNASPIVVGSINLLSGNTALEKTSVNEFLQYSDTAPIFNDYGLRQYTISFDIKSANVSVQNTIMVYMQNGSGARYGFVANIPVSTSYVRRSVTVTPSLQNINLTQSMLAFYGTYGTGNISSVKNVKIEFGAVATDWSLAP